LEKLKIPDNIKNDPLNNSIRTDLYYGLVYEEDGKVSKIITIDLYNNSKK
jgi:hypothetical protein